MIELEEWPELTDPVLIAAFEGWNDAGESATAAIRRLAQTWDARTFAAMDPEEYYDFQVNRPTIGRDRNGERRITWPTTKLLVAKIPGSNRDVVFIDGVEPSMKWRGYVLELLEACDRLNVSGLLTVGALLADVPHTRAIPVTSTSNHTTMLRQDGIEPATYEGPTGIVGVLGDAAHQAGLPAVSLWAAVPHYAASGPCPKASLALLRRLETLLDVTLHLPDLADQATQWELSVDDQAENDPEIREYVRTLEQAKDTTELPEASGDAIAEEFERYLRRNEGESPA